MFGGDVGRHKCVTSASDACHHDVGRCCGNDVIAQGAVDAVKEVGLKVPLVVRLEGTNVEAGKKILNDSDVNVVAADDLDDAAQKIVAAVGG